MAGPIAGTWRANNIPSFTDYEYPEKWGTGVNPIHESRDGQGRNIAVTPTDNEIDSTLTDPYAPDSMGYSDEDRDTVLWGYGADTGTADRPGLDSSDSAHRVATVQTWPEWGPYAGGAPGGQGVRSENKGADLTSIAKASPQDENPPSGIQFKRDTYVNDPTISDPKQYVMQTSMEQLHQERAGSQTPSGRANEYNAGIASRIPGMKLPLDRGSAERHSDMQPKSQDLIIRPFWNRSAGTGPVPWMRPNAMYESEPFQRTPPNNPYQGSFVPGGNSVYQNESQNVYGYQDEDVIY